MHVDYEGSHHLSLSLWQRCALPISREQAAGACVREGCRAARRTTHCHAMDDADGTKPKRSRDQTMRRSRTVALALSRPSRELHRRGRACPLPRPSTEGRQAPRDHLARSERRQGRLLLPSDRLSASRLGSAKVNSLSVGTLAFAPQPSSMLPGGPEASVRTERSRRVSIGKRRSRGGRLATASSGTAGEAVWKPARRRPGEEGEG
jgi:hypothetical protein